MQCIIGTQGGGGRMDTDRELQVLSNKLKSQLRGNQALMYMQLKKAALKSDPQVRGCWSGGRQSCARWQSWESRTSWSCRCRHSHWKTRATGQEHSRCINAR